MFYMPTNKDFGIDSFEHYGTLTYIDEEGTIHEEKVKSVNGDYGRVYDDLYDAIVNNKEKKIKTRKLITDSNTRRGNKEFVLNPRKIGCIIDRVKFRWEIEHMKLFEIYFSPTGGTKKVADLISKQFDYERIELDLLNEMEDFSKFTFSEKDLCIIATPSFGGRVPMVAMSNIKKLNENGSKVILVAQHMGIEHMKMCY